MLSELSLLYGNENWEFVKLGEVCKYEGGTQPPKETFLYEPKEGCIRLLQIRDYKSEEWATYIPQNLKHKTCDETDIMIGRYGPPVFQILKGKKGAYNVALIKTIPDETRLLKDYLYNFLNSNEVQEEIISLSMRARQAGVSPKDLDNLNIPLPPLEIQQEIIDFFDKIIIKKEFLKVFNIRYNYYINKMFELQKNDYNLVGTRYRETDKSSGKWEMVRLGDLINADLIYAQKGKTITKDTVKNGNIPVIAGGQTSPYSHNKSTHDGNIITMSASGAYSGFIWYHDYPIWASDCSVFYSKDETKLLTKYLYHMLKHQQDKIYAMQNGAGQPHVYIRDVETLYIPLPPISEQQKLVDELDKIQTSIQSAKDLIALKQKQYEYYRSELLNFE